MRRFRAFSDLPRDVARVPGLVSTWLLLQAIFKDSDVVPVELRELARKIGMPYSTLHRGITYFEKTQRIQSRKTPQGTLLKILNSDLFHDGRGSQPNLFSQVKSESFNGRGSEVNHSETRLDQSRITHEVGQVQGFKEILPNMKTADGSPVATARTAITTNTFLQNPSLNDVCTGNQKDQMIVDQFEIRGNVVTKVQVGSDKIYSDKLCQQIRQASKSAAAPLPQKIPVPTQPQTRVADEARADTFEASEDFSVLWRAPETISIREQGRLESKLLHQGFRWLDAIKPHERMLREWGILKQLRAKYALADVWQCTWWLVKNGAPLSGEPVKYPASYLAAGNAWQAVFERVNVERKQRRAIELRRQEVAAAEERERIQAELDAIQLRDFYETFPDPKTLGEVIALLENRFPVRFRFCKTNEIRERVASQAWADIGKPDLRQLRDQSSPAALGGER